MRRVSDGKKIGSFPGWSIPVGSSDGTYLAAISDDADKLAIWELSSSAEIFKYTAPVKNRIIGLSFDSEAKILCAIQDNEGLSVVTLQTGIKKKKVKDE